MIFFFLTIYYSGHASVLYTCRLCLWNGSLRESSQNPWTPWSFFYCYLACPSLLRKRPHRSLLGIAALTHSGTAKAQGLKPRILGRDWVVGRWGLTTVGSASGGGCCAKVWTTMPQEYPLYCKPLSPFRSHSMSSPRLKSSPLFIPALRPSVCLTVGYMGEPNQKVLDLVLGAEWMHYEGGLERRKTLFVLNWCGRGT